MILSVSEGHYAFIFLSLLLMRKPSDMLKIIVFICFNF